MSEKLKKSNVFVTHVMLWNFYFLRDFKTYQYKFLKSQKREKMESEYSFKILICFLNVELDTICSVNFDFFL